MSEQRLALDKAAHAFLRDHPEVWKAWLPADIAAKVANDL